jgi:hypothetical protein
MATTRSASPSPRAISTDDGRKQVANTCRSTSEGVAGFFVSWFVVRSGTLACGARLRLRSSLADVTVRHDGAVVVGFQVSSSRSDAEPSLAVLASGCAPRSREGASLASGGCLPSPTPPEADDLRLADVVRFACSSRFTEPSEASGEAGGTEASLRVGALTDRCRVGDDPLPVDQERHGVNGVQAS